MKAYLQGRSYHYIIDAINLMWIDAGTFTLFVRYETRQDGVRLMDIQRYAPAYRPWETAGRYREAQPDEVNEILQAMEEMFVSLGKIEMV